MNGAYTFNDAVSGTTLITIKKAIESDHGTDTGWSSAYGDGQATFPNVTFTTSYWTFDGQSRTTLTTDTVSELLLLPTAQL